MSLALALLGYGYICWEGRRFARRMAGVNSRFSQLYRRLHPGWFCLEYVVDVVLMGGAIALAVTHTLR